MKIPVGKSTEIALQRNAQTARGMQSSSSSIEEAR